jgi:hypothetical protein
MRTTNIAMYAPNQTEPVTFSLGDKLVSSKYRVRAIMGLDAEEITPKFYGFGTVTKSRFYNFGLRAREIVMRIVLRPRFNLGESYSDVRDELYRVISANRTGIVTLHFNANATNVAQIHGFITKFEAAHFNKEPEVQITIRCDDPMFRAINPVKLLPEDIQGLPALDYPDVNVSDVLSTAPHGLSMKIIFNTNSPSFTIRDTPTVSPDWMFRIIPSGGFITSDILYLSSEFSNKYLTLDRGGNNIYMMDLIEPSSIWPIIFPGENKLYFGEPSAYDWEYIEYYPTYWGV